MKYLMLSAIVAATVTVNAQSERDKAERAALDYLEGFYEGDTSKLVRSVDPAITKYGYYKPKGSASYEGEPMSYKEMLDYALKVKARGKKPSESWPKKVEILDVLDQTAALKVTAWWGTDYLLLAKVKGTWKIRQVLWQDKVN